RPSCLAARTTSARFRRSSRSAGYSRRMAWRGPSSIASGRRTRWREFDRRLRSAYRRDWRLFDHHRRHGADQHRPGHGLGARMPDVDGVLEIEVIDQFGEIVGVMVHVVAVPRLTGTAMAAEVMTDAAIAVAGEEEHLVLESIRRGYSNGQQVLALRGG